jgi:integrase
VSEIRLHDLRHTHATIQLNERPRARHVVSARLGHASSVVTMTVYAHVLPGSQSEAATRFAELVKMARCPEVSKTSITSPSGASPSGL